MRQYYRRNKFNVPLTGNIQLRDPSFGTGDFDTNGDPIVDWKKFEADDSDEFGFYKDNVENGGIYYLDISLPFGTMLARYGNEYGHYTAPIGTKYEELSLPYLEESVEYHEYRVIADSIVVRCEVRKGRVAPKFNCPGGGVQFYHLNGIIRQLIRNKILERVL